MSKEKTGHPVAMAKISGHVRSSKGEMLKGAEVACNGIKTRTLADGFFILNDLSPRKYKVKVSLRGFKQESKAISIRGGETITQDFILSEATGTAKIYGHIFDAESKKTIDHGATTILILPRANRYKAIGEDGYYEFENLLAGKYKILVSVLEYEDCEVTITVADDETKTYDFFCKAKKTQEPPWG